MQKVARADLLQKFSVASLNFVLGLEKNLFRTLLSFEEFN